MPKYTRAQQLGKKSTQAPMQYSQQGTQTGSGWGNPVAKEAEKIVRNLAKQRASASQLADMLTRLGVGPKSMESYRRRFERMVNKSMKSNTNTHQSVFDSLELPEDVQNQIAEAFEEKVTERVEEALACLDEISERVLKAEVKTLQEQYAQHLVTVNEKVGKFVEFVVGKTVPQAVTENAKKGFKYGDMLSKIEEGLIDNARNQADAELKEEFAKIQKELHEAKTQYAELYESTMDRESNAVSQKKTALYESEIEKLSPAVKPIVEKVLGVLDITSMNEDDITSKIQETAALAQTAIAKRRARLNQETITETVQPARFKQTERSSKAGRGRVVVESNYDVESASTPAISDAMRLMERFTITPRG